MKELFEYFILVGTVVIVFEFFWKLVCIPLCLAQAFIESKGFPASISLFLSRGFGHYLLFSLLFGFLIIFSTRASAPIAITLYVATFILSIGIAVHSWAEFYRSVNSSDSVLDPTYDYSSAMRGVVAESVAVPIAVLIGFLLPGLFVTPLSIQLDKAILGLLAVPVLGWILNAAGFIAGLIVLVMYIVTPIYMSSVMLYGWISSRQKS